MATIRMQPILLALCLAALAAPAAAQVQTRAYAPENLRTLSTSDQARVISLEYQEQSGGRQIPQDQLRFYLDQVNRSNWGFSQIKADIGQSLAGSPRPPAGGDTVRCESSGGARTCRVPWSGPSRLVQQLSSAPCDEGRTWQSQNGQVYVGNGCRGLFAAATAISPPVGNAVRCESVNNRAQLCNVPWSGPSRLSRQLPGSAGCAEGRTWQSQNGRVYVGGGCRGEFVSAAAVQPVPPVGPRPPTASVVCSSNDYRPVSCAWPSGARAPRLVEQLSKQPCTQGRTWGFSGSAVWVSQGCRGRFGE